MSATDKVFLRSCYESTASEPQDQDTALNSSMCVISRDLDYCRDDEHRAGNTENEACYKPGPLRIFPDAENGQRPVDADRNEREKQPESRQRLDLIDPAPERIDRESG